jgi:hypothetical protein
VRFWAIEARPGELLVDEAVVDEAVSRISGITTVEALLLFSTRVALDGFMEGFLPDGEVPAGRQELEAMAGAAAEGASLRFPVFDTRSLIGVMETMALAVRYVALDLDTLRPSAGVERRAVRGLPSGVRRLSFGCSGNMRRGLSRRERITAAVRQNVSAEPGSARTTS